MSSESEVRDGLPEVLRGLVSQLLDQRQDYCWPEAANAIEAQQRTIEELRAELDTAQANLDEHREIQREIADAASLVLDECGDSHGDSDACCEGRRLLRAVVARIEPTDQLKRQHAEQLRAVARAFIEARELINDLRSYCDSWEWKWGKSWDAQIAEIDAARAILAERADG